MTDNSHRFAAAEGVTTLYKFRPFETPDEKGWVREILLEHKVWFSRSSQLNDPHDLRPLLRFRSAPTEWDTRLMLLRDANRTWARSRPPMPLREIQARRARIWSSSLDELELEMLARAHLRLEEGYWIFSLATSRDWLHMWNLYGQKGRGLAIHFHGGAGSPFGYAQRVIYQDERPVLLVPMGSDREVADVATLTKTMRWAGESEYRLIRYPDDVYDVVGLRFKGQHGFFPASALAGITVGTEMPEQDVRAVMAMAAQHEPPLPVWRPQRDTIIEVA